MKAIDLTDLSVLLSIPQSSSLRIKSNPSLQDGVQGTHPYSLLRPICSKDQEGGILMKLGYEKADFVLSVRDNVYDEGLQSW